MQRVPDEALLAVCVVGSGGRARSRAVQSDAPAAGVIVQNQQERKQAEENPAPQAELSVGGSG
ncbi:MAG TPA: hypothetical protein VKD72_35390 [Gemmataceae bacterium]|nr:hypothetical protein [Gemmataceae bacterium]